MEIEEIARAIGNRRVIVKVAEPDRVGSATDTAVTVTAAGEGTVAGAV